MPQIRCVEAGWPQCRNSDGFGVDRVSVSIGLLVVILNAAPSADWNERPSRPGQFSTCQSFRERSPINSIEGGVKLLPT